MYQRFRASKVLTGTQGMDDLQIFRLVCEEDERTPYDIGWWNFNYNSLGEAAQDVKQSWLDHQLRETSNLAGLDPDFDESLKNEQPTLMDTDAPEGNDSIDSYDMG
jgi:hypothetical protein